MPISFVALGTFVHRAGAGTVTPGLPAGILAGDLLLLVTEQDPNVGGGSVASTPSGWTRLSVGAGLAASMATVDYKFATGSDTAPTVTINNTDHGSAMIGAWRGVDSSVTVGQDRAHAHSTNSSGGASGVTSYNNAAEAAFDNGTMLVMMNTHSLDTVTDPVTITNPNANLSGFAFHGGGSTTDGNGGGIDFASGIYPVSPNGTLPLTPFHVAFSSTADYSYQAVGLVPIINGVAVAGTLGHVTVAGAVVVKNGAAVAGTLGHATASGAVVVNNGAVVAGSLSNITASGLVVTDDSAVIAGALGNVSAAIVGTIGVYVDVAGVIGSPSASGAVEIDNAALAAGMLGNVLGAADIGVGLTIDASGLLGSPTASADIAIGVGIDVAGLLGAVSASAEIAIVDTSEINTVTLSGLLAAMSAAGEIIILNEATIAGSIARVIASGHVKDATISPATDPLFIIDVPAYDRTVLLQTSDRTAVVAAVDRITAVASVDRTINV